MNRTFTSPLCIQVRVALATCALLLCAGSARAQFDSAQVSGVVQDTTGGVLPGVDVTLTNTGAAPLDLSSVAATGDFGEVDNCPRTPATLATIAELAYPVTATFVASAPPPYGFNQPLYLPQFIGTLLLVAVIVILNYTKERTPPVVVQEEAVA